jgi:AraC family transcriptional regulator
MTNNWNKERSVHLAKLHKQDTARVDWSNEKPLQDIQRHQPLLTGGENMWHGIYVHNISAPPGETFETVSLQHALVTRVTSLSPAAEDRWIDGQFQHEYHSHGDSFLLPASAMHRSCLLDSTDAVFIAIEPHFLNQVALDTFNQNHVELIPHFSHPTPLILQLVIELRNDLAAGCPSGPLYGESIAHTLTAHLLKHYTVHPPKSKSLPRKLSNLQVQQVIDYIQGHLDQPLPLAELSAIAQLSPYYFTRLFKQTTGFAPHQFVIHRRIERAKHLLKQKKLSIAQVALEVGFTDQGHFTKCFQKFMDISPKFYRDSQ